MPPPAHGEHTQYSPIPLISSLNKSLHCLLLALLLTLGFSAQAGTKSVVKVTGVVDGDTLKVLMDGQQQNVRLHGIDAPEREQEYGQASTKALRQITTGRTVTIDVLDQDRYGRPVVMVYADGACVNEIMLQLGYAWVYTKYCTQEFCGDWMALQNQAKIKHAGLWASRSPMSPWEWRHGGTGSTASSSPAMYGLVSGGQDQPFRATPKETATGGSFSGNVESRKFHRPGCKHFNCRNCSAKFATREQALAAGYSPCGICKP